MPQVEDTGNDGSTGPEYEPADTNDADIREDVPSTEAEIEPGINQDRPTGEGFSSEPVSEASGNDDA